MLQDRGLKKWQGFFMPEQVAMLNEMNMNEKKAKKPHIDEQEFEEIGFIMMDSLNYTLPIKVTIWIDGFYTTFSGIVDKVDILNKYILLETDEDKTKITIDDITAVERI